jgi:hypothetical protein
MRSFGYAVLAAMLSAAGAHADVPDGWHLARDGAACEVDFPQSGDGAMLTIAVMPPQHLLLLQHPAFPAAKQSGQLTLAFDDGAPIALEGMGSDHIYGFAITPETGMALRRGRQLTASVGGKSYVFRFEHADVAMDEAARCAGTKTLPEVWAEAPKPVPGVPGWMILENLAGTGQCSVRRNSDQVNTSLALTAQGRLLLIAGRPDWAKWGDKIAATLVIDAAAPVPVEALGVQNLVMLPVIDEALLKQLHAAKTLTWHLPWGDFRAEVEGLGAAESALRACSAKSAANAEH